MGAVARISESAPVIIERSSLYSPRELYDREPYADSTDALAYAWSHLPPASARALARALHDHYIDEALDAWKVGRRLIGVMGGHALDRDDAGYRDAARLGHRLGQFAVVATGGGPGAMEAANLGGFFAKESATALDAALGELARVPSPTPSVDDWVRLALAVADDVREPHDSLGIPTWFYGHEPPNVFVTGIAKYFRNATREAILLQLCNDGIVFLPGAAGTVQEIFQDACENYYSDATAIAPMILVGHHYWTTQLPAWPLLTALAGKRLMADHVHLVDSVDEAAQVLAERQNL